MSRMTFQLNTTDGAARRGEITFPRGTIQTPAFMPVGTYGTVKGMLPKDLADTGAEICLGNTFHLMLRPGTEVIEAHGSLHGFMQWDKPILTDSGGFQVFSLGEMRKISEQGVVFKNPINGDKVELTPERAMQVQRSLGSDICMIFDECTPFPATEQQARDSMELSLRWAKRSKDAHEGNDAACFGIVQGGMYDNLRRESLAGLVDIGFDGYAVGGLSVGEPQDEMLRTLGNLTPHMPQDRPRYLMGVGKPDDIVGAVKRGIDMMDCVLPSRSGRTGQVFTRHGVVNIKNARHQDDPRPMDEACTCPACRNYSRAYLHHVFRSQEIISSMLLTWHNLHHFQQIMGEMRAAIAEARFDAWEAAFHAGRAEGDIEPL